MKEEDLAKTAREYRRGNPPREEKDRARQTTWANCLQQGAPMLSTAVMRSVQITQSLNYGSADHSAPLIKHRR